MTLNVGTATKRGSAPFATPYSDVAGFVIAAAPIEPTLLASVADTLTTGDDCAVAGFVKLNVTTQAVPDVVPPGDAAVRTSCPELCVHAPVVPRRLDVDVTAKFAEVAVCEPVSPVIVTVDPFARLTLAVSITVNVLVAPDTGVLCCIVFTLKAGTTMKRGSAPFATPIKDDPGVIILSAANDPEPDAAILIAGAACVEEGFITTKANVYVVPDDRVNPV